MLTPELVQECIPNAPADRVEAFAETIDATFDEFAISTTNTQAAFLAQIAHESGSLKYVKENLNYSSQGLLKTFGKYFDRDSANDYARNPERIANRVYANRMGNGGEDSDDGWLYRGRGLIQITGRTNYEKFFAYLNEKVDPEYLETPEGAARSAGWFWDSRNLTPIAEAGDIRKLTKMINGGYNGLEERIELYENALHVLSN